MPAGNAGAGLERAGTFKRELLNELAANTHSHPRVYLRAAWWPAHSAMAMGQQMSRRLSDGQRYSIRWCLRHVVRGTAIPVYLDRAELTICHMATGRSRGVGGKRPKGFCLRRGRKRDIIS